MKPSQEKPVTEELDISITEEALEATAAEASADSETGNEDSHECCGKCQGACSDTQDSPEDTLKQAQEKEKEAQDKYLRLHAEFENYRRRTAREQLDLIETANGKLLERLSEVQDNFERAFSQSAKDAEAFEKGVQLIQDQFLRVLKDFGLESIDPSGELFDPNIHEAFLKQPSEDIQEGHIITVFQKGYRIKNKILKTAKVIVSSGPSAAH